MTKPVVKKAVKAAPAPKKVVGKPPAVVITTKHGGVYFGYAETLPTVRAPFIRLSGVRCALSWPASTGGVVGLASAGPPAGAKIGPTAPSGEFESLTSVITCTSEAEQKWLAAKFDAKKVRAA